MRISPAPALLALALAACQGPSIDDIAQCQRALGTAEGQLGAARAAHTAAEAKLAALEDRLAVTREELAVSRKAAEDAVRGLSGGEDEVARGGARGAEARASADEPVAPRRAEPVQPVKVGLSLPTQREERWVKDKLTMIAEARRRGVELRVKVSDLDAAQQLAQCEALIAEGVKVLILAPHDGAAAAAIVEKAVKAGVKVVSYDRLVIGSPREYLYLSFDNVKVGELQGELIARTVPRGEYIVLAGAPSDNNATLFRQGAMKYLQPLVEKGEVTIVLDQAVKDWAPAEAQRLCDEALAEHPGVAAVLAPNDGTAGGCIEALASRGLAGKVPITGQDAELAAAIRIRSGTQTMTVFKDTRALGRKAIELASDLARGRAVSTHGRTISNGRRNVPAVLLTPHVVTRENLDDLLVKSGYLPREAVYKE